MGPHKCNAVRGLVNRMSQRDSDRPREKKTWRERDKARESGQPRQSPEDRDRERGLQANTSAYDKYKKNLEKLWSSGNMVALLEERGQVPTSVAEAAGVTAEVEPQRAVIKRTVEDRAKEKEVREAIRKAVGPMEVKAAVTAFLAFQEVLPDELEFLSKVLASPVEQHQTLALRGLDQRLDLATSPSARLLKGRLQTVALTASDDETKKLAQSVRSKLG